MTSLKPIKPPPYSIPLLSKVGLLCLIATATAEAKTITIQPNDTLSEIIYTHYPNANNPLEIMRKVHAGNPDAFVANNPNRLIVGKQLVLDDEAPKTLALEAQTRLELLNTEKQSLSTQLQTVEKENAELKQSLKRFETDQQASITQMPAVEEENAQLKLLIKRFETEQKSYDANIQQLESKITALNEKIATTTVDPTQAAAANDLTAKLTNDLKKAQEDYATLQLQLKEVRDLAAKSDQQLADLNAQLTTQQDTNKALNQALQEARELTSQLTLDLQNKQQNSNLPWILAGGTALLLLPLLWLIRRRPVEPSTDNKLAITPVIAATTTAPDTLKVESGVSLTEPMPGHWALGFNEGNLKLNIARAYLDKRDAQAASELLQEVLREGDEAQKQQAREILSFIS